MLTHHTIRTGPNLRGGRASFSLYAPELTSLAVRFEDESTDLELVRSEDGFWYGEREGLAPGARYHYRLNGSELLPDPASHHQPEDVHGPSALVEHATFPWTDQSFVPPPKETWIVYELHVGTFTPEGTLDAAVAQLDRLVALGVTTIELLPLAAFPGTRNWGYDGVYLYAVHESYGGPKALKRFVDAAHARGLAVILDVVLNHLGPEGNYLGRFGPYFTKTACTPWGQALNLDGPGSDGVRTFLLDVCAHWLSRYHLDGLRLDAVFMLFDQRPQHLLAELAELRDALSQELGKPLVLHAEDMLNRPALLAPTRENGLGMDAVWSDDFHHAVHACLTGERTHYYADYGPVREVLEAMAHGFGYRGRYSKRYGRTQGVADTSERGDLPGEHFVFFLQNHDQTGNRPKGERLSSLLDFESLKLAAALLLTAPAVPLLFMGEEYGETAPFPYFTDHGDPTLNKAVKRGRAREHRARGDSVRGMFDPTAPATFSRAVLCPELAKQGDHARLLALYTELIRLRKAHPLLARAQRTDAAFELDETTGLLTMCRGSGPDALCCVFNFSAEERPLPCRGSYVLLDTADAAYGGPGSCLDALSPRSARILRA